MAFHPVACTKYIPGCKNPQPKLPSGPTLVRDIGDIRAAVPPEVRQFPVATTPSSGTPQLPRAPMNAAITGTSPRPPHRRNGASGDVNRTFSVPTSYDSREWESMSKAQFKPLVAERVSPRILEERRRATVASSVPVGFTKDPFMKTTHHEEFFGSYDVANYAAAHTGVNRIGGPNEKTASSVVVAESATALPGQYTTMMYRQFQPPKGTAVDPAFVERAQVLKQNLNATHWSLGVDRPDYKPVSSTPLPSTAPLVKNRPPSAGPRKEDNIFIAHNAAEARPRMMTPQEVAADKARSAVPLMGNALGHPTIIQRNLTASVLATPGYVAVRREMIKSGAPFAGAVGNGPSKGVVGLAATSSPGLRLGAEASTEYTPMTKAQFRGVFFAPS